VDKRLIRKTLNLKTLIQGGPKIGGGYSTIIGYLEYQRKDGFKFIVLEISGSTELIQLSISGNFYATLPTTDFL
jgi:hypothetical protein